MNTLEYALHNEKKKLEERLKSRGSAWDGRYGPLFVAGFTIFVYFLLLLRLLFS